MKWEIMCSVLHKLLIYNLWVFIRGLVSTNLDNIPILNYSSKEFFVLRVILLLLQVSCVLEGKGRGARSNTTTPNSHLLTQQHALTPAHVVGGGYLVGYKAR